MSNEYVGMPLNARIIKRDQKTGKKLLTPEGEFDYVNISGRTGESISNQYDKATNIPSPKGKPGVA